MNLEMGVRRVVADAVKRGARSGGEMNMEIGVSRVVAGAVDEVRKAEGK
jgi:hypothetical protein